MDFDLTYYVNDTNGNGIYNVKFSRSEELEY